jgi:hypothetical protein
MWDPNISQPYRPPRHVTGIALLPFNLLINLLFNTVYECSVYYILSLLFVCIFFRPSRIHPLVCVCVYVCARARDREGETKRQSDGVIEGGRNKALSFPDLSERRTISRLHICGSEHYARFYPHCREHHALNPRTMLGSPVKAEDI